ncbi:hypothetical protein N1851_002626 [Merluccius polli]|uniref:Uncharacterized protein n=1 Tax=Merluccius polli TaxID=89951 RepID=A0AA47PAX2_MERPO|nr:hypothetical protein N1851_002626 [Merluccius polli]
MAGLSFVTFLRVLLLLFLLFVTENFAGSSGGIVYTREQMIALCKPVLLPGDRPAIPQELRGKHRGCRAGTKRREKRKRHKPAVPAIIMGNVRSLGNKMDELSALVKTQREYRECSLFCFSETWLHSHIPDSSVEVPVRGDRDCSKSRKKKGGGLALYVSERWCNPGHVSVKERLCTLDIELTGDFNHASLNSISNNFHQYVDCPTRDNKTLDLLYANH